MYLGPSEVTIPSSDFESMSNKRALPTVTTAQDVPQFLGTDQTSTQIAGMLLSYLKLINAIKLIIPRRQILVKSFVISDTVRWAAHEAFKKREMQLSSVKL